MLQFVHYLRPFQALPSVINLTLKKEGDTEASPSKNYYSLIRYWCNRAKTHRKTPSNHLGNLPGLYEFLLPHRHLL